MRRLCIIEGCLSAVNCHIWDIPKIRVPYTHSTGQYRGLNIQTTVWGMVQHCQEIRRSIRGEWWQLGNNSCPLYPPAPPPPKKKKKKRRKNHQNQIGRCHFLNLATPRGTQLLAVVPYTPTILAALISTKSILRGPVTQLSPWPVFPQLLSLRRLRSKAPEELP